MAGFALPTFGSSAREAMGDIAHVAEVLNPANIRQLPDFRSALASARKTLANAPMVRAVNIICLRADDERWLIRVGRKGGWTRVWNFGTGG